LRRRLLLKLPLLKLPPLKRRLLLKHPLYR
jgi:hypothetical protein